MPTTAPTAPNAVAEPSLTTVADLAVVIVSYHCRDDVLACLRSLDHAAVDHRLEIVVVDNGSTDGTSTAVRRHHTGVRMVELGRNAGFAVATNHGIEMTTARHVLLLNPDTIVEPGALDALLRWVDDHPGAGVVAPRLCHPDGSDQLTARAFPTPSAALFGRRSPLTRWFPRNRWSARFLCGRDHTGDEPFEIDWVSGAALLVPRAVIDEVGPLDAGYFLFWEDADWCRRIKDAGYQVWCVPASTVRHDEGGTRSHGWPTPVVVHFHRGAYRYWRLHHAPQWWNPLRWLGALALAARASAIVARERRRDARQRAALASPSAPGAGPVAGSTTSIEAVQRPKSSQGTP